MPWLESVSGKPVVVKLGGNAITEAETMAELAKGIAKLVDLGIRVVVVHGGGPQITAALQLNGIQSSFSNGLRITPLEALPFIADVLMKEISEPLSEMIQSHGVATRVLNGVTAELMLAEVTHPELGRVGEVFAVRDGYLRDLIDQKIVPVISTVAPDEDGVLVNVNADLAASSIAAVLQAEEILLLTDVSGLYRDWPNPDSLINEISVAELEELLPKLESGMIPKVEACLAALYGGVSRAMILNGSEGSIIESLLKGNSNIGTTVRK